MLKRGKKRKNSIIFLKRAQITIFVIIAIAIVAIVGLVFYFREKPSQIPEEIKNIEGYMNDCILTSLENGITIIEAQGGRIELPEYERGSGYMPFSNQLNFFGIAVPYWYYISGNNIEKERVPSLSNMEKELEDYILIGSAYCDFTPFLNQGYNITIGSGAKQVDVRISDDKVEAVLKYDLYVETPSGIRKSYNRFVVTSDSDLGSLYKDAVNIFEAEKSKGFFETLAVDVLRLYAPVDGSELTCGPKFWRIEDIEKELLDGISLNFQTLKFKGTDYKLKDNEQKYFVVDAGNLKNNVNIFFSKEWPYRFDVSPKQNENMLFAKPFGLEEGVDRIMGMLGFCYVPYHFVYQLGFSLMIQVYDDDEMFQFPIVISLENNMPRGKGFSDVGSERVIPELCNELVQDYEIYTQDSEGKPVEAYIRYKCFGSVCDIGNTKIEGDKAVLIAKFPQCIGGTVIAKNESYVLAKQIASTNIYGSSTLVLNKIYNLSIEIDVGAVPLGKKDFAIVTFVSDNHKVSIVYPEQKEIQLAEGVYDVDVLVYREGELNLPSFNKIICSDVPERGLFGFFGKTTKKCNNVEVPGMTLTHLLVGGGSKQLEILDSDLKKGKVSIRASYFAVPKSIEELQEIYAKAEIEKADVFFG